MFLYKAIQALARLHLWHFMTLGLALRRDFMAILRLNLLAYLLTVVSDLPDDYTNDRASAAPFCGSAARIVWGFRGVG